VLPQPVIISIAHRQANLVKVFKQGCGVFAASVKQVAHLRCSDLAVFFGQVAYFRSHGFVVGLAEEHLI